MTIKELAGELNRTFNSVKLKLKVLGIRKKRPDTRRWLRKRIPTYPRLDPEKHRGRKLTTDQVDEIRAEYALTHSLRPLARKYGITPGYLYRITHPEASKRYQKMGIAIAKERMRNDPEFRKRMRELQEEFRKRRLKDPKYKKWFRKMQMVIGMRNYVKRKGKQALSTALGPR